MTGVWKKPVDKLTFSSSSLPNIKILLFLRQPWENNFKLWFEESCKISHDVDCTEASFPFIRVHIYNIRKEVCSSTVWLFYIRRTALFFSLQKVNSECVCMIHYLVKVFEYWCHKMKVVTDFSDFSSHMSLHCYPMFCENGSTLASVSSPFIDNIIFRINEK